VTAIRSALETAAGHLAEHPDEATELDTPATAILFDGLRCRVQGPFGELTTDMATSLGGGASAPSPGWLMRAALASCDATIVAMEAARAGIDLTKLAVTVVSESDNRGVLGVGDADRCRSGCASRWPRATRRRTSCASSSTGRSHARPSATPSRAPSP
jgi:hypothetical protein